MCANLALIVHSSIGGGEMLLVDEVLVCFAAIESS